MAREQVGYSDYLNNRGGVVVSCIGCKGSDVHIKAYIRVRSDFRRISNYYPI
jgi:hypothetical protein